MQIKELEECTQIEENSQVVAQFVSTSNEDDLPSELFKEEGSPMLEEPVSCLPLNIYCMYLVRC